MRCMRYLYRRINIVEVPFDKEHLLERIISPDNLLKAYKAAY